MIDYPKGIHDIDRFLVYVNHPTGDKNHQTLPEHLLTESFHAHSKLIQEVAEYIHRENSSNLPYQGNILTTRILATELDNLDSVSPTQKQYHDGGKYYGTFRGGLR